MTDAAGASVSADSVASLMERAEDVHVLDVRTPGEFGLAHIPGSYNVPLETLSEHAETLRHHLDNPVVLVCERGGRAAAGGAHLAAAGLGNVFVLRDGIAGWQASGRSIARSRRRWSLERQIRLVAGSIVLVGIVGSHVAPRLKYLSGAVGAGLTFAALSDTCAMGALLSRLPYNRVHACDVDNVIAHLTGDPAQPPARSADPAPASGTS